MLAQNSLALVSIVSVFLLFSPIIGLVMVAAAVPGAFIRLVYSRKLFRYEMEQSETDRRAWYFHWMLTDAAHAKEIRVFDLGNTLRVRYKDLRKILRSGRLTITRQRSTADAIVQGIATLAIFATLGFIAYSALTGRISLGDLVAIYLGFQVGLNALQAILRSLAALYEDNLFLTQFYEFMNLEPGQVKPVNPASLPERLKSGVKFENVKFRYPTNERFVLENVNVTLNPGQVIALVGENGSGKTTLVKLLCGLYSPTSGQISVDGIDLREIDPAAWRRKISLVFQDFIHYQLKVNENIQFGNVHKQLSQEEIRLAAIESRRRRFDSDFI